MLYEDELGIMRSIFWSQIVLVYHLPIIINLLEIPVLLDDTGILVVLKPIATFLLQFMVELCIELVVIDTARIVNDALNISRICKAIAFPSFSIPQQRHSEPLG